MNKHAIYHIPDTPYVYGKDLNTLIVRIRAAKGDTKGCNILYKDRYAWQSPYETKEMTIIAESELFEFYQTEISLDKNRYRYYFEFTDMNNNVIYFDERGFRDIKPKINEYTAFQFAYLAEGDLYTEEKWLQESTVYQIFPDRFCMGNKNNNSDNLDEWGGEITHSSTFGGDLQGIIDKLDYLEELGINLIYLTPVFKSTTNHKYNTADYFDIDPQFGTLETVKKLVEKCHEKDMKIIFDAVFNHSGCDFFAFEDLVENQEHSKYKDWYFIDSHPVNKEKINYYTFADDISNMPKLNTCNKEVIEYLLKVGEYWIKEIGIDGWRLDVCDEVDHEFWRAFNKVVKAANKNAVIIGEIMHEASSFLRGEQLDGIMNYPFKGAMVDFFATRSITAEQFEDVLSVNRTLYMDSITRQMWNLLGSHDTKRFLTECDNNLDRMKLAIAFQFSYIGVPYIYYGDEIGLEGAEDPQNRKCMVWEKEKQNKELLELYKTMISIRKENDVLVYGDYQEVYCKENVIVFERNYEGKTILVAINNNDIICNLDVDFGNKAIDIISSEEITLKDGLTLNPMEFKLFRLI